MKKQWSLWLAGLSALAVLLAGGAVWLASNGPSATAVSLPSNHPVAKIELVGRKADAIALTTLLATSPTDGDDDVRVSASLLLRYSDGLNPGDLTAEMVSVLGPEGPVGTTVTLADAGKTIVIQPKAELYPATRYNIVVNGVRDIQGRPLPAVALGFTTENIVVKSASDPRLTVASASSTKISSASRASIRPVANTAAADQVDLERWQSDTSNRHGHWRTGRALPDDIVARRNDAMSPQSRKYRDPGHTPTGPKVSGIVLRQSDKPLANVKVSLGDMSTVTDANGEFALVGLTPGQHELIVDGRSAGPSDQIQYGYFVIGVNVEADDETPVAPIYLPKITASDWIDVPAPLAQDTIVRTPAVPGMEIRIPQGAVMRDREGKIVTKIAIVPIPLDRSPFPFPENAPAYVSVQPGGMTVQGLTPGASAGIRVYYPNQTDLKPGERVSFWTYHTDGRGWQIYGEGQASSDGSQVVPDTGVALYESIGFMYTENNPPAPTSAPGPSPGSSDGPGPGGGDNGSNNDGGGDHGDSGSSNSNNSSCDQNNAPGGDPVDCKSGLFVLDRTDTLVRGVIPIRLTRIYRPGDTVSRSFGYGTQTGYAMYLREVSGTPTRYQQYDLILPNGSYVRFYRTSPGSNYTDVVAVHNTSASSFYAAIFDYENGNYVVTKKDGTKYIFSLYGTLQTILDRRGNHLDIAHNGGQITRITSTSGRYLDFTYDASNRITQVKDFAGRTWSYGYSSAGYLTQVTYPDTLFEQYSYNTSGQMITVTDRRSNTVVTNQYDANGRVQQQTLADGTSTYTFAYTLDSNGNVTQTDVTDPRSHIRRVTYGPLGYKASVTYAAGTSLAQTWTYARDNTSGLVMGITDPLGRNTTFQRDSQGNITQRVQLAGTSNSVTQSYQYSGSYALLTSYTDPLHHTTTYTYDAVGNLLTITDPLSHTITYTRNAAGQPLTVRDGLNHPWTYTYDPNGDPRTMTDPLGHTQTRFIDSFGRTLGVQDPLNRQSLYGYNVQGRLTSVTDALGRVTTLSYDPNGNLLSVTDPNTGKTQYAYDKMNRPTSRTDAMIQTESWTYDGMNNVLTYTDRKQQKATATYDALNRVSQVIYADNSTVTPTFDGGNRLTQMLDSVSGTIIRSYDGLDRLMQEQTPQGAVSYNYDAANRRTTMTPASQAQILYSYDDADRLTLISQGSETIVIGYDSADRRSSVTLPNGVITNYGYDVANQLTGITYKTGAGATLSSLAYSYDAAGQRLSQTGGFVADPLATATSGSATFDLNNRQTKFNGQTLGYDANGDPTTNAANSQTYTFDARHRLTSIANVVHNKSTTIATFAYDTFGRRTSKTINGTATTFLYDGANPVQETQGSTISAILTGLGIDERFARSESTGRNYFLTDALGSTLALTDASAAVKATYGYEPYGEVTATGSSNNPYQYAGRENDGTGLYYYRARYYSPSLKRFISEDPIGLGAGLNGYAYANGNPGSNIDPSGNAARGGGFRPTPPPASRSPFPRYTPPNGTSNAIHNPGGPDDEFPHAEPPPTTPEWTLFCTEVWCASEDWYLKGCSVSNGPQQQSYVGGYPTLSEISRERHCSCTHAVWGDTLEE